MLVTIDKDRSNTENRKCGSTWFPCPTPLTSLNNTGKDKVNNSVWYQTKHKTKDNYLLLKLVTVDTYVYSDDCEKKQQTEQCGYINQVIKLYKIISQDSIEVKYHEKGITKSNTFHILYMNLTMYFIWPWKSSEKILITNMP